MFSLVDVAPLKPTLIVVNAPNGPANHHRFVPQSITPVGYCPLRERLPFVRLSKVTVWDPAAGGTEVAVAVGLAVGVPGVAEGDGVPAVAVAGGLPAGPLSISRLSKLVSQPLVLPIVTGLQAAVQFVPSVAC